MEITEFVERFYGLAVEYCRWAESGPYEKENEVYTALQMVAALYLQALVLPSVDPGEEDIPDIGITKLGSQHFYERFKSLPFQYYREIFHPLAITESPEEPVIGDIVDDLMDIYTDLKKGILLYECGKPLPAVFQWRTMCGFLLGPTRNKRHESSAHLCDGTGRVKVVNNFPNEDSSSGSIIGGDHAHAQSRRQSPEF